MIIEAALIKPVVDALMGLFRQGENLQLKRNAEAALREAIRELLLANPNDSKAEARIAVAKAAGILSEDILLAEKMLSSHRATAARTRGKSGAGRPRKRIAASGALPGDDGASGALAAGDPAVSVAPPAAPLPPGGKRARKPAS